MAIASVCTLALAVLTACLPSGPDVGVLTVRPSEVDSRVRAFDEPNVVLTPANIDAKTPLVVLLPGTGNQPRDSAMLLRFIVSQGYRVIGLEYDDDPGVSQVCPRNPDPNCSGDFRRMRSYGDGPSHTVSNPSAESIDTRLTMLLSWLAAKSPDQGWGAYVKGGHPDWSQIVVSGASQGAGMAAFIAKRTLVKRVVLFSSPWDWTISGKGPAPWLSQVSSTPPDRWYAEYHRREATAGALRAAYAALAIPHDHIFVFDRDIPARFADAARHWDNPYHGLTMIDDRYAGEWRAMFGKAE
jgi:hypothetical protein